MEYSVIAPRYRYLGLGYGSASLALFQRLKERCQAVGVQFSLLWRNICVFSAQDRDLYHQSIGQWPAATILNCFCLPCLRLKFFLLP